MDFSLTDDQESLRTLAADIFGDKATAERVEEIENSSERFDRDLWRELAGAGLLGIALPEASGGAGLGLVELALVCEQHGRVVAPIPLAWTATAAMALATHGDAEQQAWAERAAAGEVVLTAILPVAAAGLRVENGTITGEVAGVPYAHVAGAIVVPVRGELYLLDPAGPGVTVRPAIATTREIHGELILDQAPVQQIGSGCGGLVGGAAARRAGRDGRRHHRRRAAPDREVHLRAAAVRKAAVDVPGRRAEGRRRVRRQRRDPGRGAAGGLAAGRGRELGTTPAEASAYVLTAAWWAAEAGQHCVHITQHLHGGLGADITYPIHRYFLWGKSIELYVGGASRTLARLGDVLLTLDAPGDDITIPGYATA